MIYDKIKLYDGKTTNVLAMIASNDGYYWEYAARIQIENNIYTIDFRGSYSDYSPNYHVMALEGHEPQILSGIKERYDIESFSDFTLSSKAKDDYDNIIHLMYMNFQQSGAQFIYEEGSPDSDIIDVHVDGKKSDYEPITDIDDITSAFDIGPSLDRLCNDYLYVVTTWLDNKDKTDPSDVQRATDALECAIHTFSKSAFSADDIAQHCATLVGNRTTGDDIQILAATIDDVRSRQHTTSTHVQSADNWEH